MIEFANEDITYAYGCKHTNHEYSEKRNGICKNIPNGNDREENLSVMKISFSGLDSIRHGKREQQ